MNDDDIQLKAQSSLQEYDDAVENLAPNFAELGQRAISALDDFINYWNERPEMHAAAAAGDESESDMKEYVERQLEWAQYEKNRVLAQLPRGTGKK